MVMSTKDNFSPILVLGYNTWMIFLFGLLSFQKCAAYDVNTSCPSPLTDNTNVILSCFVNKTYINAGSGSCATRPSVSFNFASNSTGLTTLCFSLYPTGSCGTLPTGSFPCGCTNETGEFYTFQYNFTAIKSLHENGSITCAVKCSRLNISYFHEDTCSPLLVDSVTTTLPTTKVTTTLPTTKGPTTSKSECPEGCIAAIVIAIILFITIVILVIIIVKCKRERKRGRRFYCCSQEKHKKGACPCGFYPGDESSSSNEQRPTPPPDGNNCNRTKVPPTPPPDGNNYNRTEVPTINTKAEIGNNWTELTTTTAPGGNNRTELNIQDAKEMQDRNKHLGTDNSPEKEKRRKKKKKKKTFQEVDGEPVSREEKSTINDHKAAQNDNSVSVDESSHAIDNGGHRSLPMPKISHLTPVERNSTIVKSETPRKLPPLQLKQ